jgi:hypothetical protein
MGSDGPISATFNVVKMEGVETVGKLQPRGQVTKQYDKMFGMELRFFEKKGQFVQRVRFTQSKYVIDCYLEYGACNDEMCLPPTEVAFKTEGVCKELKEDKKEIKEEKVVPVAPEPEKPADTVAVIEIPAGTDSTVTAEVQEPVAMPMVEEKVTDHSLLYILLMVPTGFLFTHEYVYSSMMTDRDVRLARSFIEAKQTQLHQLSNKLDQNSGSRKKGISHADIKHQVDELYVMEGELEAMMDDTNWLNCDDEEMASFVMKARSFQTMLEEAAGNAEVRQSRRIHVDDEQSKRFFNRLADISENRVNGVKAMLMLASGKQPTM